MEAETKLIYIDSDNIENKVGNDKVYIESQIDVMTCDPKAGEFLQASLESFTCRNDFYQMTDSNNSFGILQNSSLTTFQLRNGFPSVLSIDNELKQDLETATGEIWNVTYSNYTGKITIASSYTGAIPSDLALDFRVANSAYLMLGFDNALTPFNVDGSNVSLTAPKVVNLGSRVKAMYIRTDLLKDQYEATREGLSPEDILATIPVNVSPLNTISFLADTVNFKAVVKSASLNSFTVRITNRENELIGLNSGFQMVIRVTKHRQPSTKHEDLLKELVDITELKWLNKANSKG